MADTNAKDKTISEMVSEMASFRAKAEADLA